MNQEELLQLAQTLAAIGTEIEVSPEELNAYYPQVDEQSFYLPAKPKPGFYYDGPGLRQLTTVNPEPFRRLLGI